MLKIAIYVALAAMAIVLGLAATKPDSFQVQRSASIQAPPEKLVGLIDDFHQWGSWSPWEKLDPAMKKTYSGAPSGKGSVYAWQGNSKVGAGRMEILEVTAEKVTIKLDFLKPFEGHNVAEFALAPQGGRRHPRLHAFSAGARGLHGRGPRSDARTGGDALGTDRDAGR